jgi:hypothetical protein
MLENFDPSKLVNDIVVNPQGGGKVDYKIRVIVPTENVDFGGMRKEWDLDEKGLNYSPYPGTTTVVVTSGIEKNEALVLRRAKSEVTGHASYKGKMTSLIQFLTKDGIIQENHNHVYLIAEPVLDAKKKPMEGYWTLAIDPDMPATFVEGSTQTPDEEPAEAEIDQEVAATA